MNFCNKCGNKVAIGDDFCRNCGQKIARSQKLESDQVSKQNMQKSSGTNFLGGMKIDEATYAKQVEHYNDLKITESFRGISFLFLILSAFLTLMLVIFAGYESGSIIDVLVILIISVFVYYGKKWALIAAMIYWTYSKAFLIYTDSSSVLMQVIWWMLYMRYFLAAYKIESIRGKMSN